MYRYDEFDETLVRERVAQFRGQIARRLAGELTEDEFKPLRLMNGLYLQLHSYMLRIAVPYGTLSSRQTWSMRSRSVASSPRRRSRAPPEGERRAPSTSRRPTSPAACSMSSRRWR